MKRVDTHSKDDRAECIARRRVLQAGAAALCVGMRNTAHAASALQILAAHKDDIANEITGFVRNHAMTAFERVLAQLKKQA